MKIKLKTILFLTAICQLLTANGYCLDLGFAREDGGQPGAFLQFGAGARSLGMGKTFVGVADDASAVYWNPAGLAQLKNRELNTMYASLYEHTNYSFAAYAQPSEKYGTIGLAMVNLNSTGFQLRDTNNNVTGEGGAYEIAGIVSYAKNIWKDVAAGASFKLASQIVDTHGNTGLGMDLGLYSPIAQSLTAGLSVQNIIAPKITLAEVTNKYPLAVTLGLAYRMSNNNLLVAMDLNKTENRSLKVHLGGEYILAKVLAVRAGLDETEATAGLGFNWQNYSIDYAYAYHDAWAGVEDLGSSHRIGLSIRFGGPGKSEVLDKTP